MWKILSLILLYGCSQVKTKTPSPYPPDGLVTVHTALEQARSSYLRGCVEANKALNISGSYPQCLEKAVAHHRELQSIMDQTPVETAPPSP